jgi:predicted anti-sigma-YlaC factor YlaD
MSVAKSTPKVARSKPPASHVRADLLGLHVLGDLPIFQRFVVEEHLSGCGSCRSDLRHLAQLIEVFRSGASEVSA